MRIVNGRKISDKEGHFTCITSKGASMVDYILISQNMFDSISDLKIGFRVD